MNTDEHFQSDLTDLWWLMRIGGPNLKTEVELSVSVESLVRVNNQLEAQ